MTSLSDQEGVRQAREGAGPPPPFQDMGRWSQAVQAALMGPEALRELAV